MSKNKPRICVLGGGLSGLSAAYLIMEDSRAEGVEIDLTVLEADDRPGGKIRTLEENGFVSETGPNGFLNSKPNTLELCRRMGYEDRLLRSSDAARRRYIFSAGKLNLLPEDPMSFLRSELISIRGRLRIGAEYFVPQRKEPGDETLADFVRRRMGDEALDKLVGPMASGVFAGDPENMSLGACFPKVKALEDRFGGLLRGMLTMKKEAAKKGQNMAASAGPGGVLMSFEGGMEDLIHALCERLGNRVVTSAQASTLKSTAAGYSVTHGGCETEADVVVLALPAYGGATLLRQLDAGIAATMDTVPYARMAVVHLGYRNDTLSADVNGFGFLIPQSEGRRILGSLWASSIFAGRAAAGHTLLTVMIGGATDPYTPRLDESELIAISRDELKVTMSIEAEPVYSRVIKWEKAIPQYTFGHLDRVASIESRLTEQPGLFLTGNAWHGVGINDCVASGQRVASHVLEYLKKN